MRIYSDAFEHILNDPVPIISDKSVTKLWFYMYGFQHGRGIERKEDSLFDGFQNWIAERSNLGKEYSWANILLFRAFGSEYEAFVLTKQMWFEYKAEVEQQYNNPI